MKLDRVVNVAFYCIVVFTVYAGSFFLLQKPCKYVNKCPLKMDEYESGICEVIIYPSVTVACISEKKIVNTLAYYFYWPVHKFIVYRNCWYFIKDPTPEGWEALKT